jgi:hypothetical protein
MRETVSMNAATLQVYLKDILFLKLDEKCLVSLLTEKSNEVKRELPKSRKGMSRPRLITSIICT